jgi:hypothetical protein
MRIYRGFLKKGEPVEVIYVEFSQNMDAIDEKFNNLKLKTILSMNVDKPENIAFLEQVAKNHASNSNVWIGIRVEGGFDQSKLGKLVKAYEKIRKVTKTTVVIQVFKEDGACLKLHEEGKQLENVMFSVEFQREENLKLSVEGQLKKIKAIENDCNFPVITRFSIPPKVGRLFAFEELKKLLKTFKIEEDEKKRILKALRNLTLSITPAIEENEYLSAMIEVLIKENYGWYAEHHDALFKGCFKEAS